ATVENPFGNIIYTYNTANRLTQAGQRHYDYDVNGNLLKEYTDKELISYSYTPDNRVAEYQCVDLRLSKNGSEYPEIIQNYRYDGLGRRVSLSARNTRNALPETRYEFYEYEGMGFSFARLQFSSVSTENDFQKAPSAPGGTRYRPAPGSEHDGGTLFGDSPGATDAGAGDNIGTGAGHRSASLSGSHRVIHARGRVASRVSTNSSSWPGSHTGTGGDIVYSHDRLGSVVRESSMTGFGMAAREYSYDAFGTSIGTHSPEFFGYTGKPYDPITGMYDYGFRDYAPMQARFTTVDPIRDGANWYAYVGNDPVNFVDPLGLEAVRPPGNGATPENPVPDPLKYIRENRLGEPYETIKTTGKSNDCHSWTESVINDIGYTLPTGWTPADKTKVAGQRANLTDQLQTSPSSGLNIVLMEDSREHVPHMGLVNVADGGTVTLFHQSRGGLPDDPNRGKSSEFSRTSIQDIEGEFTYQTFSYVPIYPQKKED
ncbi:RHS repeat-associated core domain-containing protein, partial [Spirochaeta dissipatitropha]